MNILLVMINSTDNWKTESKQKDYYYFGIGISFISSYLKKMGYQPDCLNLNHYEPRKKLAEVLSQKKYDFVCTGGFYIHLDPIENIVKMAREANPDTKIVIGGPIASCDPEFILDYIKPEFVTIGEAEETIVQLFKTIETGGDLKQVTGIAYKNENGEFVKTPDAVPMENLDQIPFPDYEGFEYRYYLDNYKSNAYSILVHPEKVRLGQVICARGCPAKCTFCFHLGGTYRFHSIEYVKSLITFLKNEYNVTEIDYMDDVLAMKKDRVKDICDVMQPLNMPWVACFRIHTVDEELLTMVKNAGCRVLSYGFESASRTVLKSMRKGIKVETIGKVLDWTRKAKIGIQANFIFGDPAETLETAAETLSLAEKYSDFDISMAMVIPFPGSQLYVDMRKAGRIKNLPQFYKTARNENGNYFNMTQLTNAEFLYLQRLVVNESFFRTNAPIQNMKHLEDGRIQFETDCPLCEEKVDEIYLSRPAQKLVVICPHCLQRFMFRYSHLAFIKNPIERKFKEIACFSMHLFKKIIFKNPKIGVYFLSKLYVERIKNYSPEPEQVPSAADQPASKLAAV